MSAPRQQVISADAFRRLPWRNGAGWTREIAAGPGTVDAATPSSWEWRISIAEIDSDAPFSTFPGVDRECLLLRGEGVALETPDEAPMPVMPPFGRQRFAGERPVQARLVDGPVQVFNLMWQRARRVATTWHRPLVGSMLVFVDPGDCWIIHVLAGSAQIDDGGAPAALSAGDSVILGADGSRRRHRLQGGGDLLLARLAPVGD